MSTQIKKFIWTDRLINCHLFQKTVLL